MSSTSSPTSRLSFQLQETATRRGLADPVSSPMLDVSGSWNPPAPCSASLWLPSFGPVPERFRADLPPTLAETFHLHQGDRDRTVRTLSLSPSACTPARTPLFAPLPISVVSGTASTLLPSFLGAVVSLPRVSSSAFLPAVSLSAKILKLHALELGSHRGFAPISYFDEETERLVGQGGLFLSSRVKPSFTELSGEAEETLACLERIAGDKREAAGGLRCDSGSLVAQARRMAAHLGDFLLRLSRQLCRQCCCSSDLLCHLGCPLFVSLLFPRGVSPGFACSIPPGLERRHAPPAPTRQCRS